MRVVSYPDGFHVCCIGHVAKPKAGTKVLTSGYYFDKEDGLWTAFIMEPGSPVKMIQEIRCEDEDMAKIQLVEMAKDYAKEYRHNIANIQGQPMHERLLQLISRGFPDGAVVVGKLPDNTERFLPNSCGYFLDTSENAWVVYLSHVTEPIPVSQMLYKTEEEAIAGLIKLCDGLIELNLSGGDLETFDPFPDK